MKKKMNKETKEVMKLFLKLYAFDKCHCGYETIQTSCPIHGVNALHFIHNQIWDKLYEEKPNTDNQGEGIG